MITPFVIYLIISVLTICLFVVDHWFDGKDTDVGDLLWMSFFSLIPFVNAILCLILIIKVGFAVSVGDTKVIIKGRYRK